jgi:hypothetical protein
MIILRDVIMYGNNGQKLVAETEMTEEQFDYIRTTTMLNLDETHQLPSIVYWFNGGHPPESVYRVCPKDWRGIVAKPDDAIRLVNRKANLLWHIKYKPPTDSAGGNL